MCEHLWQEGCLYNVRLSSIKMYCSDESHRKPFHQMILHSLNLHLQLRPVFLTYIEPSDL